MILLLGLFALALPMPHSAAGEDSDAAKSRSTPKFGGPDATENQIEDDAAPKQPLIKDPTRQRWLDWKERLAEQRGLSFGVEYSAVYLAASE